MEELFFGNRYGHKRKEGYSEELIDRMRGNKYIYLK